MDHPRPRSQRRFYRPPRPNRPRNPLYRPSLRRPPKHRAEHKLNTTAITRIEQLNPFPWAQLRENLDKYPNAKTIVWAQEEPLNAGAWSFTQPRIETLLNETEHHDRKHVMYAGRNPSASVATGLKGTHMKEELDMLDMAFGVVQEKLKGE